MVSAKCAALTQRGTQCSRRGTKEHDGSLFCTQHYKMRCSARTVTAAVGDPEPWACLRLSAPKAQNGPRALQKLRAALKRGPSKSDEARSGFVYVYRLRYDGGADYWKVGMTTRGDCGRRLAEWKATYAKEAGFTAIRTYATRAPRFAERLVHLYLHYCRMYRYPLERGKRGHHSVWALDNRVIKDGQQTENRKGLVARRKNTEWFCAPLATIHAHLREITAMIAVWNRRKRALL